MGADAIRFVDRIFAVRRRHGSSIECCSLFPTKKNRQAVRKRREKSSQTPIVFTGDADNCQLGREAEKRCYRFETKAIDDFG
jgi:hypothetical protein